MRAPKRSAPKTTKRPQLTRDDDALTKRVRAALADVPDVTEKKIFGSTGFMVRGKLCITARDTRLMSPHRSDRTRRWPETQLDCANSRSSGLRMKGAQTQLGTVADANSRKAGVGTSIHFGAFASLLCHVSEEPSISQCATPTAVTAAASPLPRRPRQKKMPALVTGRCSALTL